MYKTKHSLSILVVEDNTEILDKIISRIAYQFGFGVQILTAKRFKMAKSIIEKKLYDIAIIDLQLPDGHGEDLIALIREKNFFIPIIVQTSEESVAYQAMVHNKYENLIYLTKDTLFDELENRLEKANRRYQKSSNLRLATHGGSKIDCIDINDICYISSITN